MAISHPVGDVINQPARGQQGGVSLRATAVDKSGNSAEETIVDSYLLGD